MALTNCNRLATQLGLLRSHGITRDPELMTEAMHGPWYYQQVSLGYNYRMTDIQGAVGVVQLAKLDQFIDERDAWANYYAEGLKNIPWLRTPEVPEGYKHGWQSYVTQIDETISPMKRNDIMEILQQKGISTRPGTHAVHMLDVYAKLFKIKPQDFPNAFKADQFSMSIPMHNRMTKEDFDYVIEALQGIK